MSEIVNNITGHKNVCTEVVARNLCIGCGICASICPRENLKIEFNKFGEYNALEIGNSCGEKCNLCLQVCPFYNDKDNEDTLGKKLFAETPGIKHTPETGYYLNSFVGYSNIKSHRENGASGGLATWTLEKLLTGNLVDHVACVSGNNDPEKLFKFKICNTPEEVRECSRSCYYPVETSEVIKHILSHKGRYAIIALPCMCKAIRLAMHLIPKLQRRIRFMLGLVCNQTKSKFFVEYICGLGGGDPNCLRQVTFRIKAPSRPASDFGLRFISENGVNPSREGVVFWTEGMNRIWFDRYFTPNACDFCDDVFAECSDATFMDAWLPEYVTDGRGHSIVLTRNREINNIFLSECRKKRTVNLISIDATIRSQSSVLFDKRSLIRERYSRYRRASLPTRPIRSGLMSSCRYDQRVEAGIKLRISRESPSQWISADKDIERFRKRMRGLTLRLGAIREARKFLKKFLGR
ncbi:MAG: Coenzyme F420 hydrogenase/dehydrogenase, beta subunit C-terminal domain [Phycisphaerae bacterium]|nr:Coenzyme F420 hydrogenase/dehydrogenase, beta subunit C-terminal domain [Phycisphaerae bacterium]